jgi:acyl carrier protein
MKHKNLIANSFNENEKKINEKKLLSEYNWDSMTKISLITAINKKFKKNIDYRKFNNLKTFEDLDKLISKTLK